MHIDPNRPVGGEARKSYAAKARCGFWERFITGSAVLDVGFRGHLADTVPIVDGAIGVDVDYPGYDGRILPFPTESQDAVYSSHCLEHMPDYVIAIQEWHRVAKIGGHIITVVPNALLYERRRRPPSAWNVTHVRFFTPATLLNEFESALLPNTYRVRHFAENDFGYNYDLPSHKHPEGCYEIELVIEKIRPPAWDIGN